MISRLDRRSSGPGSNHTTTLRFAIFLGLLLFTSTDVLGQRVENRNTAGQIIETYTKIDDKRQGPYASFYANGAKNVETQYDRDNINGRYVAYHATGKIAYETTFAAGQLTGTISEYYESGQLRSQGTTYGCQYGGNSTSHPLKTGLWITYHPDGKKASEGQYDKNNQTGRWFLYHKNGGVYCDATFQAGQMTGTFSEYYENGQLKNQGTTYGNRFGSPFNPLKTGLWTTYHENGKKASEGEFVKDNMNGRSLVYHKNGKVYLDATFEAGQMTGTFSEYHENGQLANQGTTYGNKYGSPFNPLKTGLWVTCNAAGNLTDATNYDKDIAVGKASDPTYAQCQAEVANKVHFVRERNAGFEQVKELVYDQPFYVEAHYDVSPAQDQKEVKLEWAAGQSRSVVLMKTEKDPKIFRSEKITPKRPTVSTREIAPANPPEPGNNASRTETSLANSRTTDPGRTENPSERYRVVGVAANDQLTIRSGPGPNNGEVGKIPSGATGVRSLGEERQVGTGTWVKVNYGGVVGWVNKRFLVSGR